MPNSAQRTDENAAPDGSFYIVRLRILIMHFNIILKCSIFYIDTPTFS